jgi:hypothetical protein
VQPVSEALDLEQKILAIRAGGGGIYVYDGLDAARKALAAATTPLRHVLLFSDCADSEQQTGSDGKTALELSAEMLSSGVTISVIGIGYEADKDTAFLRDLADRGGGKFYLTDDATKLRALFVEETGGWSTTPSRRWSSCRARSRASHDRRRRLRRWPQADRIPASQAAQDCGGPLEGPGDPILVTWRYGLGQVVAWAVTPVSAGRRTGSPGRASASTGRRSPGSR